MPPHKTVLMVAAGIGGCIVFICTIGWWVSGTRETPARPSGRGVPAPPAAARPYDAAAEEADVRRAVSAVVPSLCGGNMANVAQAFDLGRFFAEAERIGGIRAGKNRNALVASLPNALVDCLKSMNHRRWKDVRVRRVAVSGYQATVTLRMDGGSDGVSNHRYWLVKGGGGWRFYDGEDVDHPVRLSQSMHIVSSVDDSWKYRPPSRIEVCFRLKKWEDALSAIAGERASSGATGYDPVLDVYEASALRELGRLTDALRVLEAALQTHDAVPAIHIARARIAEAAEQHDVCIDAARRFIALVGDDGEAWGLVGDALQAQGKSTEAAEAFAKRDADR